MMKYNKLVWVLSILFGLNSCVDVSPDGLGYTVNVPLNMINTSVASQFPQKQETAYGTLLIDKPNILGTKGSNQVGVGTSFMFSNMLIPNGIKGSITFSSGIRYNRNDKGLYLASPMIDNLTFQNFSLAKYLTPQMRTLIGNVVAKALIKKPIYHMNNIGASFIKDVAISNGNLVLNLGL